MEWCKVTNNTFLTSFHISVLMVGEMSGGGVRGREFVRLSEKCPVCIIIAVHKFSIFLSPTASGLDRDRKVPFWHLSTNPGWHHFSIRLPPSWSTKVVWQHYLLLDFLLIISGNYKERDKNFSFSVWIIMSGWGHSPHPLPLCTPTRLQICYETSAPRSDRRSAT